MKPADWIAIICSGVFPVMVLPFLGWCKRISDGLTEVRSTTSEIKAAQTARIELDGIRHQTVTAEITAIRNDLHSHSESDSAKFGEMSDKLTELRVAVAGSRTK